MGAGGSKSHEASAVSPSEHTTTPSPDGTHSDQSAGTDPAAGPVANAGAAAAGLGELTSTNSIATVPGDSATGTQVIPSEEAEHKIAQVHAALATEAAANGQSPPTLKPIEQGQWEATPAEVIEAQTELLEKLQALQTTDPDQLTSDHIKELIAAEDRLSTAWCPEVAAQHAQAVAQAKLAVDDATGSHPDLTRQWLIDNNMDDSLTVLNLTQAAQLNRKSTDEDELSYLTAVAENRTLNWIELEADLPELMELHDDADLDMPITSMATPDEAKDWLTVASNVTKYDAIVSEWNNPGTVDTPEPMMHVPVDSLKTKFRQKSKEMPLNDLRGVATDLGMDPGHAAAANRSQLNQWLLSGLDADPKQSQADVVAKLEKKPSGKATSWLIETHPAASSPTMTGGTLGTSGLMGNGSWAAGHKNLMASLKHQAASVTALPTRPDPAMVAQWPFSKGPAMNLKGIHSKEVLIAPDGSTWLFKHDSQQGARAVSESVAGTILHQIGIPSVPVYSHQIGGKPGALQPMITGAKELPADPGMWSQADVDSIVRFHVGAWLIGDHDAKYDNILRTNGGGLVPIDHGQAFKFYGQDRLAADYRPNGQSINEPVWVSLFTAAKHGKLAPGVTIRASAATPALKAVDAMPDDQFAALLGQVGTAGADNPKITWRNEMIKRLTQKGIPHPTKQQIRTEFVDFGVERKQTLRRMFQELYASEGVTDAAHLTKVA